MREKLMTLDREAFPIGVPVVIEAIIDGSCGWEFSAPMHVMRPFHRYFETGSICVESVEEKIEDLMIDLDAYVSLSGEDSVWPYANWDYLNGLFLRCRRGKGRQGVSYFRVDVTVSHWSENEKDWVRYDTKRVVTIHN